MQRKKLGKKIGWASFFGGILFFSAFALVSCSNQQIAKQESNKQTQKNASKSVKPPVKKTSVVNADFGQIKVLNNQVIYPALIKNNPFQTQQTNPLTNNSLLSSSLKQTANRQIITPKTINFYSNLVTKDTILWSQTSSQMINDFVDNDSGLTKTQAYIKNLFFNYLLWNNETNWKHIYYAFGTINPFFQLSTNEVCVQFENYNFNAYISANQQFVISWTQSAHLSALVNNQSIYPDFLITNTMYQIVDPIIAPILVQITSSDDNSNVKSYVVGGFYLKNAVQINVSYNGYFSGALGAYAPELANYYQVNGYYPDNLNSNQTGNSIFSYTIQNYQINDINQNKAYLSTFIPGMMWTQDYYQQQINYQKNPWVFIAYSQNSFAKVYINCSQMPSVNNTQTFQQQLWWAQNRFSYRWTMLVVPEDNSQLK